MFDDPKSWHHRQVSNDFDRCDKSLWVFSTTWLDMIIQGGCRSSEHCSFLLFDQFAHHHHYHHNHIFESSVLHQRVISLYLDLLPG